MTDHLPIVHVADLVVGDSFSFSQGAMPWRVERVRTRDLARQVRSLHGTRRWMYPNDSRELRLNSGRDSIRSTST